MNCRKCNKEIADSEYHLFNTYCQKCWPEVTDNEKKLLPDFCRWCGFGTWHKYDNGVIGCGRCGRTNEQQNS